MSEKYEQFKRLHVIYEDFIINPIKVIQSFIGIDAEIIDYKVNSIISDGYVVVDVRFKSLDLDPCKIYWTKFKDCKKLNSRKDDMFITTVNGCNICLNIVNPSEKNAEDWIPFVVSQVLTTSKDIKLYNYYGNIIDSPFHFASTNIFMYNRENNNIDYNKCDVDKKLEDDVDYDNCYICSYIDNFDNCYVSSAEFRSAIYNVKHFNTFEEVQNDIREDTTKKLYPTIYAFDIRTIGKIRDLHGIIYTTQKRETPWTCCYINITNAKITNMKIEYMKQFMYNDYLNYLEWLKHIKQ